MGDEKVLATAVGVRLALMMYASRISFLCGAELLNCLWMLASRCWGREAILIDVRIAADDMTWKHFFLNHEDVEANESNCSCYMATASPRPTWTRAGGMWGNFLPRTRPRFGSTRHRPA